MLLWLGQFANTSGLMILVPIMPFYLEQLGTRGTVQTQTWAGVAIAAPALALTFTTPLWGRLGDRIGRKWMVVRALLGLAGAGCLECDPPSVRHRPSSRSLVHPCRVLNR
jgi:MFS family permease